MEELTDPTDWAPLPLNDLGKVDSLLRCDICKDFYSSAVITTCSHTFCSLCIRRCLAAEGRCPSCRASEQEVRLRKNAAIQELTDAFKDSRKNLLDLGRAWKERDEKRSANAVTDGVNGTSRETRGSKRKHAEVTQDHDDDRPARRTRSQRKAKEENGNGLPTLNEGEVVVVDPDHEADSTYTPTSTAEAGPPEQAQPDDGLVACPLCNQRMKENQVSGHLDNACPGFTSAPTLVQSRKSIPSKPQLKDTRPPPERLPQLSYNLLNESKLRKKLSELGIPSWGSRQLLQRRHSEWLAIWNANCDSSRPRNKAALLKELDAWEKSQGGRSVHENRASSEGKTEVMDKDFDGKGWVKKNKNDFDDLIRRARENRSKRSGNEATKSEEQPDHAEGSTETPRSIENPAVNLPHPSTNLPLPDNKDPTAQFDRALTAPPSTDAIPTSSLTITSPLPQADPFSSIVESAPPNPAESPITTERPTPFSQRPAPPPDRKLEEKRPPPANTQTPPDPPPPASLMWSKSIDGEEPVDKIIPSLRKSDSLPSTETEKIAPLVKTNSAESLTFRSPPASRTGLDRLTSLSSSSPAVPPTLANASGPIGLARTDSLSRMDPSTPASVSGPSSLATHSRTDSTSTTAPIGLMNDSRRGSLSAMPTGRAKKLPMFQMPSEPVVDSDMASLR